MDRFSYRLEFPTPREGARHWLDVLKEARGKPRSAVTRTFTATASEGRLELEFTPSRGEAVVSNIMIRKQGGVP